MNNDQSSAAYLSRSERATSRAAFTLVEILVATVLTLLIMAATVSLFGSVTEGIAGSRAIIETMDRLRGTSERLVLDLQGVTARMPPPLRPEWGMGYFEYKEGPGTALTPVPTPQNPYGAGDSTVGDTDDVLMFTTRSETDLFFGRFEVVTSTSPLNTQQAARSSRVAEVAWFVRGTTLYRRVLLVMPHLNDTTHADAYHWENYADTMPPANGASTSLAFYDRYDVSARQIGGTLDPDDLATPSGQLAPELVANSLADLTKRENRYAHQPRTTAGGFPHSVSAWSQLGLPTLRECSDDGWPLPLFGATAPNVTVPATVAANDYWGTPHPWANVDALSGTLTAYPDGARIAEDIILTNVIGFDVKVWDPGAPVREVTATGTVTVPGDPDYGAQTIVGYGAYVDLGWQLGYTEATSSTPESLFHDNGSLASLPQVYDTWSTHYESDGVNQDGDGVTDEGADGSDNDSNAGADDPGEREAPPPYPYPLRGIQVKIRVFEPDSRQIREVTIVQDFLPE